MANEKEKLQEKVKYLELKALVTEDEQRRLQNIVDKRDLEEQKLKDEMDKLKEENANLKKEVERLKTLQNNDGTNFGIPTSKTPLNKKKVIPNFAKNTGEKKGRRAGHPKDKLEKLPNEKIKKIIEHKVKACPHCNEKDLTETGKIISKDVIDYKIITYNTRHNYIEYRCNCCGKIVHELIPNHLKEECQYGSTVKSLVLTLTNVGNVPYNKTRRILSGLSMKDIELCEGYLVKL